MQTVSMQRHKGRKVKKNIYIFMMQDEVGVVCTRTVCDSGAAKQINLILPFHSHALLYLEGMSAKIHLHSTPTHTRTTPRQITEDGPYGSLLGL